MSTKRTRKPAKTTVSSVHMSTELATNPDSALVDGILATLNDTGADETIEPVNAEKPATDTTIIESAMEAAGAKLENEEMYASLAKTTETVPEGDKPKTTEVETVAGEKSRAPKKENAPAAPRVTFHGNARSKVLDARIGGKSSELIVLSVGDLSLSAEDLAVKQAAFKDELDNKIAKKVAEKCIMLFKDLGAKVPVKNEVMQTAFKVLSRDGYLTSGDKGNLQIALREKYSVGTARSQANQMFCLFPFIEVTTKESKGKMVPNKDSLVLAQVNDLLALPAIA